MTKIFSAGTVSGILFILLLASMFTPAFNVCARADQGNVGLSVDSGPVARVKCGSGAAAVFPASHEIGGQSGDITAGQILSDSIPGQPILEYWLNLSSAESYDVLPLWLIVPKYTNGNLVGLVANNPVNGSYMWCEEYTGVFPPFPSSEASLILKSKGYQPVGDPRLVLFNFETYWMFDTVEAQKETDAFVAWSNEKAVFKVDVLTELLQLQSSLLPNQEYAVKGASTVSANLDEPRICKDPIAQSYSTAQFTPPTCNWMVGKVPYFMQGGLPWCGIFAQKDDLWWYGQFVSEYDIASYLGVSTSQGTYLDQLDASFVHFLGHDDPSKVDHTWGSSDMPTEKSWIYANSPSICAIHAPGSGGDTDEINHAVLLVGWDDSLGGGSWCLHDSAPWITSSGVGYDVWISYGTFESYWYAAWESFLWVHHRHGAVMAEPLGNAVLAKPAVTLDVLPSILSNQTEILSIYLKNVGSDSARVTPQGRDNGVFIKLYGAVIQSVNLFNIILGSMFTSYATFDDYGNEAPLGSTTHIVELYAEKILPPGALLRARIVIKPTVIGDASISYRGWLTDEDNMVRQTWITIDDSRPGYFTYPVDEYVISRSPTDYLNRRSNILQYPSYSQFFQVKDADAQGPNIIPMSTGNIYDSYLGNYRIEATITDPAGINTTSVKFQYRFNDTGAWSNWYVRSGWSIYHLFWYDIPRTEWINYVPSTVEFRVTATDTDNDFPIDTAISLPFSAGKILSVLPFADDFESGSFSRWNGMQLSSGETAAVTKTLPHHGTYSAQFASNGAGGTEWAYCYKNVGTLSEIYVRAYFYVSTSGIVQDGDRVCFEQLNASGSGVNVAWAGWRKVGGVVKWYVSIRNGSSILYADSASTPALHTWYCVELHWKEDAVNGLGELWINGVKVCSISGKNTAFYGDVTIARFGLPAVYYCGPTTVYCDCVRMSRAYIDPEPAVTLLSISANPFSPNGDGSKDTTTIKAAFNVAVKWNLQIRNSSGTTLRTWTGTGTSLSVLWNGKNSTGFMVPDGTYTVRLSGADLLGVTFTTKSTTVTVDTKPPTVTNVSVYPSSFKPAAAQTTRINYTLSESCYVTIKIYNGTGSLKINLLNNALQASGLDSVVWNGKDSSNLTVPTGTYVIMIYVVDKAGNKATSYPIIETVTVT